MQKTNNVAIHDFIIGLDFRGEINSCCSVGNVFRAEMNPRIKRLNRPRLQGEWARAFLRICFRARAAVGPYGWEAAAAARRRLGSPPRFFASVWFFWSRRSVASFTQEITIIRVSRYCISLLTANSVTAGSCPQKAPRVNARVSFRILCAVRGPRSPSLIAPTSLVLHPRAHIVKKGWDHSQLTPSSRRITRS